MNKDEFETLYMYEIYENNLTNDKTTLKFILSFFEQFSEFIEKYTKWYKTEKEDFFKSVVCGILSYFNLSESTHLKLSFNTISIINLFCELFKDAEKSNISINSYLSNNDKIRSEVVCFINDLSISKNINENERYR